ncbi:hypothetical protein E4U54_004388 [Claviceps lovelessii]|nr:hypothetical protein E4U54_004388 [Claviceps lovelessii]
MAQAQAQQPVPQQAFSPNPGYAGSHQSPFSPSQQGYNLPSYPSSPQPPPHTFSSPHISASDKSAMGPFVTAAAVEPHQPTELPISHVVGNEHNRAELDGR